MTTAHKPTFHPAVGSANQGGYRYHAPRMQYSARDMASHTVLKVRQTGQNAPSDVEERDLRAELKQREQKHLDKQILEKQRQGLLPMTANPSKAMAKIDWDKYDDSDDSVDEDADSDASESDSEDEEAELMKELERIKKEREEEKVRQEREEKEADMKAKADSVMLRNPLLDPDRPIGVKRRWDDDVVFKNQTRDVAPVKKRFINDTIRSDFHKRFIYRYIK